MESPDPPVDALEELVKERAYHLEALVELQAGSGTEAQERGARVIGLLREVERRIRMDRVDPRGKAEARKAEADLKAEARKAEADTMMNSLNRPERGLDLRDALGRWTARLRGSPSGAKGRQAELLSRQPEIRTGRIQERMTSLAKVQL